jgi:hypothetical protein
MTLVLLRLNSAQNLIDIVLLGTIDQPYFGTN